MHAPEPLQQVDRFLERTDVIALANGCYTTRDLVDAERSCETAQWGPAGTRTCIASEKALRDGVRGLNLNDASERSLRACSRQAVHGQGDPPGGRADNDRVLFRLNDHRDRHLQVNNGDRGTVTRIHGNGVDVELDNGVRRSINTSCSTT
jgi:hypothetical protein